MSNVTPLDVLESARAKIASPEAWGKGRRRFERPVSTCCAAEAIEENGLERWPYDARTKAFRIFKSAAGIDDGFGTFVEWNDAPERTHAEVLAAFDLAIALTKNFPRAVA